MHADVITVTTAWYVCVVEDLQCRRDEVHVLAAQVRVIEAEKMNSHTALESTRDQLASVTQQHSRACQHITELEVSRCSRRGLIVAWSVTTEYNVHQLNIASMETSSSLSSLSLPPLPPLLPVTIIVIIVVVVVVVVVTATVTTTATCHCHRRRHHRHHHHHKWPRPDCKLSQQDIQNDPVLRCRSASIKVLVSFFHLAVFSPSEGHAGDSGRWPC